MATWPSTSIRIKNWGTEVLTDNDLEADYDVLHTYINAMMSSTTGHKHDATDSEGPKILVSNLNLASGAAGDILYHDGTNLVRLAKGTALQYLRQNAATTAPEWVTKPAFSVNPASQQSAFASGSDVTVVFGTEVFDDGGNFATNTFTAPVTGRYVLNYSLSVGDIDVTVAHTTVIKLKTTARTYTQTYGTDSTAWNDDINRWVFSNSVVCDMTATDTAFITINVTSGSTQDIETESTFSGHLI